MNSDQQQQKGLFTFYREQADLEDELKSKKRRLKESKQSKLQNISQSQKASTNIPQKSRWEPGNLKKNWHSPSAHEEGKQPKEKASKEAKPEGSEGKDKLISILRKYNAKQIRRRDHLRVIMEMQEEPSLEQTESLKNRLEKLLADQTSHYFQLLKQEKSLNQQHKKSEQLLRKREEAQRLNPFQRLAIIPTNFTSELEQLADLRMPLKKVPSPPKSLAYSLQVRKNDKVQASITSKIRYDVYLKQAPIQPLKINLPRIDVRSNSQMINKSKIMPVKLGERHYFEPMRSERLRNKSDASAYLQRVNVEKETPIFKPKNEIHSLFIENREAKRQERSGGGQEMKLGDVVKRMKFS